TEYAAAPRTTPAITESHGASSSRVKKSVPAIHAAPAEPSPNASGARRTPPSIAPRDADDAKRDAPASGQSPLGQSSTIMLSRVAARTPATAEPASNAAPP